MSRFKPRGPHEAFSSGEKKTYSLTIVSQALKTRPVVGREHGVIVKFFSLWETDLHRLAQGCQTYGPHWTLAVIWMEFLSIEEENFKIQSQ